MNSFVLQTLSWFSISRYVLLLRDALMVRFSHYFICQLSQAICILNGPRSGVEVLSCPVFKPLHVEMPRSLVDAVVCWNIPMHQWLKKREWNFNFNLILEALTIHKLVCRYLQSFGSFWKNSGGIGYIFD